MAQINPDVLAQLHRIHSAVNDGTLDKAVVNDALAKVHDLLSGAAYEEASPTPATEEVAAEEEGEEDHPHKARGRKRR
jgi:hypothetical protein